MALDNNLYHPMRENAAKRGEKKIFKNIPPHLTRKLRIDE
jgi:hypothetical protein